MSHVIDVKNVEERESCFVVITLHYLMFYFLDLFGQKTTVNPNRNDRQTKQLMEFRPCLYVDGSASISLQKNLTILDNESQLSGTRFHGSLPLTPAALLLLPHTCADWFLGSQSQSPFTE